MEAYVDIPWAPSGTPVPLAFGPPREIVAATGLTGVRPALDRVATACAAGGFAVGYVSYEAAPAFDPAMRVRGGSGMPLLWFGIHDAPLPARRTARPYACSRWEPGTTSEAYAASITAVRAAIARGDTYQVNHTMRLRARLAGDPLAAFDDLRRAQGHGWFGYVDTGEHAIASASPELFFTWDGSDGGVLTTRPMKGTRARHTDPAEDDDARRDLVNSAKDRAENLMIVDLLRNDVARVCEPGSVAVPSLFEVEDYPTVWQLTSTVTGRTRPQTTLTHLFDALFPCGSITGAPKVSTMSLIAEFEDRPRGVYCGAVGIVFPGGAAAFNVAIRTMVIDYDTGVARYDVGGGVVWDSTGADEYAEALAKARVLEPTQVDVDLYETARVTDGKTVLEARHLDRMAASARWFGRPFDRDRAEHLWRSLPNGDLRARLLLSGAGDLRVESAPRVPPTPLTAVLAHDPVWSGDPWLRHKSSRREVYAAAQAFAAASGHGEALLWNEREEITEFTVGNVIVELDGQLVTPPVECGLLPGTLRAELIALGDVVERVVTLAELPRCGRIWLVNGVRGWVPITLVLADVG